MPVSPAVQEMFDEVVATIGGTLVDVELTESDLLVCFKKAKRTFQQKGHNSYRRQFIPFPVTKGTTVYAIPANVTTVVRFALPGSGFNFSSEDAFAMAAYNSLFDGITPSSYGCGSNTFDQLTYEMTLQKTDSMRRLMAAEPQFVHDKFANTITLLKPPAMDVTWMMECYANLTDDEYAQIDWIIRWTVAEAKHMLGIAYRKFPQLPGPTGDVSLSGSEYLQEAEREKEQLIEDILNFVDGEEDFMEIRFG